MSDPFRTTHRDLTADEMASIARLKRAASALHDELALSTGREAAVARTKLEECVMWAVKGITG